MSSTFKSLKKKASQYIRGENPSSQQSAEDDSMVSADCMARINHLVRNKSRKLRFEPQFEVVPDSPPPQLPEIPESIAMMPTPANASQDSTSVVVNMFNLVPLRSIQSSTIRIPGALPSSSSISEQPSSRYSTMNQSTETVIRVAAVSHDRSSSFAVSLLPSPVKAWLTYDEKLNRSSDSVIRHAPEPLQSVPQPAANSSILSPSAGAESKWATTPEGSSRPVTPTPSPRPNSGKGKGRDFPSGYYSSTAVQQPYELFHSASKPDGVQDLPLHKQLRRQSNLLSQYRQVSLNKENGTFPEEVPRRRSSHHHLPSTTSRSKLQWGNLSSDFASENSQDLRQLRKDLRLPSRRVSTPNLSYLRRQEVVEDLSEQPGQTGTYDPFNDYSNVQDQVFSNQEQDQEHDHAEAQAHDAFFQPPTGFFPADAAIIANLRSAVQRVEMEMARLRFENHQILHDIEAANNRAAFWEQQNAGLEEEVRLKQRELEELRRRAVEAGLQAPVSQEQGVEGSQFEDVPDDTVEDTGYDADVSRATTRESHLEDRMTLQPGDAIIDDDEDDFS